MLEVLHELERREHRLVVLVLVLHDHPVHEAVGEQGVGRVEVDPGEDVERPLADVGRELARLDRVEQLEVGPLAARVLERVVHVVEALVGRLRPHQPSQEPKLLEVRDVREVPRQRRHQRRHLPGLVLGRHRLEQRQRACPRLGEAAGDIGARYTHVSSRNRSGSGSSVPCSDHSVSRSSAGQRARAV
jgi:hypothetical protein